MALTKPASICLPNATQQLTSEADKKSNKI